MGKGALSHCAGLWLTHAGQLQPKYPTRVCERSSPAPYDSCPSPRCLCISLIELKPPFQVRAPLDLSSTPRSTSRRLPTAALLPPTAAAPPHPAKLQLYSYSRQCRAMGAAK